MTTDYEPTQYLCPLGKECYTYRKDKDISDQIRDSDFATICTWYIEKEGEKHGKCAILEIHEYLGKLSRK